MEKKLRLPIPQSGAVRNSSGPADPWMMSSASPDPMLWTSRSENSEIAWLLSAGTGDFPVLSEGV